MPSIISPTARETSAGTFEQRFKAAVTDIRRAGVTVRQNVSGCCRGCVTSENIGLTSDNHETVPHLWTFGGQGNAYAWLGGLPYQRATLNRRVQGSPRQYRDSERHRARAQVPVIFFNHGGPDGQAALVAADIFCGFEIEVAWDGTPTQTLSVITPFFDPERNTL